MIIQGNDYQIRDLFVALVKKHCCSVSFVGFTDQQQRKAYGMAFVVSSKNKSSSYRDKC